MDHISASTTPADAPASTSAPADTASPAASQSPPAGAVASAPDQSPPTGDAAPSPGQSPPAGAADSPESAGFRSRGSARRRARFLRKARELAYRDLGGLVFNLHRFAARNDALVLAKLTTLDHIDAELRAIEDALREHKPVTVLREAGVTACPRCAAIHSSEDRFCPNCGLAMGRHVDLPAAGVGAPVVANAASTPSPQQPPTPAPAPPAPAPAAPSPAQARVASAPSDEPTEILRPPGAGA